MFDIVKVNVQKNIDEIIYTKFHIKMYLFDS